MNFFESSQQFITMPGSALRRRRGTKTSSNNNGLLKSIVIGMLLICIGLGAGLLAGFFYYSPPDENGNKLTLSPKALMEQAKHLRHKLNNKLHPNDKVNPSHDNSFNEAKKNRKKAMNIALNAPASGVTPEATERKQRFMDYTPKIGGKGSFPYHPDNGALVPEDHDFTSFEPPGGYRFEEYKWGDSPYDYKPGESDDLARSRRLHIRNAMKHAWSNYERYAFGEDEIKPISLRGSSTWGRLGITLVDSLDTLWLMGMKEEFNRARDWCKNILNHAQAADVSVFETTIRSLGGLLAAFDLSNDQVFLDQAKDLGSRLFKSFQNPTGIPWGRVNLATGRTSNLGWAPADAITAEFGTLQVEFRLLARFTGNREYKTKSEEIFHILHDLNPPHGLYPYFVGNMVGSPEFTNQKLTFGAMADSFYEYMLKIWLQGGKTEQFFRDMYDESMQGMFDVLLSVSSPSELVFIADKDNNRMDTKQDHLVCFMGGLLALGAYTDPKGLNSERAQRDLKTAKVRHLQWFRV